MLQLRTDKNRSLRMRRPISQRVPYGLHLRFLARSSRAIQKSRAQAARRRSATTTSVHEEDGCASTTWHTGALRVEQGWPLLFTSESLSAFSNAPTSRGSSFSTIAAFCGWAMRYLCFLADAKAALSWGLRSRASVPLPVSTSTYSPRTATLSLARLFRNHRDSVLHGWAKTIHCSRNIRHVLRNVATSQ
jgi:hypothetical protein